MEGWTLDGTKWTGPTQPEGRTHSWTWEELKAWFQTPAELSPGAGPEPEDPAEWKTWQGERKAGLEGWSPTRFRDQRRRTENVETVGALLLDLDSNPGAPAPRRGEPDLDPDRLCEALAAALPPGTAWAAHTSPSSRLGAWRWRVVVPLSRPADRDEHRALTCWLRLRLGRGPSPCMAECDPGPSMDPARFWYEPARDPLHPSAYHDAHAPGEPLDTDATLGVLPALSRGQSIDVAARALEADCAAMRAELWPDRGVFGATWHTIREWGATDDADWLDIRTAPPPRRWLLLRPGEHGGGREGPPVGFLPRGKVGMFVAAGGAGKTMALCELALCVATGRKWLGCLEVATPGRVLLALGEEDQEEARRRLWTAAHRTLALPDDACAQALDRIVLLPLAGNPGVALTREDDEQGVEAPAAESLRRLLVANAGEGWSLVVLDPASRFAGPDVEKDNAAATRFVQVLETLAAVPGNPAVLVAHHTSQAARKSTTADATADAAAGATDARGVTAFSDAVRWQARLKGRTRYDGAPELVDFAPQKNNYAPPWGGFVLVRKGGDHAGALHRATAEDLERYRQAELDAKADAAQRREEEKGATNRGKRRAREPGSTMPADLLPPESPWG